ncbi:major facilitator superfamily domain-containing protein [Flagelloscypha sp. PMI_526]|nr:major facilitator superfamily domain-containing protein [Flagelloscypha sp. PMI_526]
MAATAFAAGIPRMVEDLSCSKSLVILAFAIFNLGFALTPLVTAAFSEEFGRNTLYFVSHVGFMLMFVMIAKAHNIVTVIVGRLLQGAFGSTAATMVGGSIADLFPPQERGIPMTIFSVAYFTGCSAGPVFSGYLEVDDRLGWRWIEWIQMMISAVQLIVLLLVMKETRVGILLTRKAKKLRKSTKSNRYRARIEDERPPLRTLVLIACTRPIYLLFSEYVVGSFSLWIAFLWGIYFVLIRSITPTFMGLHGFSTQEAGLIYLALPIGAFLGVCSNVFQERLYKSNVATRRQEARLYFACFAGVLFPASMFIYAWCAHSTVTWVAQAFALVLFVWAAFIMFLAVFSYMADCYGTFASSSLAGQSLCRNLLGFVFPLFADQMFDRLGVNWACTIFACIGTLMIPIPIVLFRYGPSIRRKSRFSRQVVEDEERIKERALSSC